MNQKKEFKIASIILLVIGIIDVISVALEWIGPESILFQNNIYLIIIFAVISIFALSKMYMGIMGIKYCNGTGKGRLHIILAKIGVILGVLAVAISVIGLVTGAGTLLTVISDAVDLFIIWWYFSLAKKNCVIE